MSKYHALIIVGATVSLLGLFNLFRALNRRKWPETIGVIQRNAVKEITSGYFSLFRLDPLSRYSSKSNLGTDKERVLGLSYVYAVDGYKYIGNQLYSAPILKVRGRIGGLNEGDKVKVFYSSNRPRVSFLAHSFAWPSLVVICIGLALIIGAAYVQINP